MAAISKLTLLRHLRSDPNFHVLYYRGGKQVRSGRGLAFWFLPLSASIAEIPCDDRDQPFLFHGRSRDFQDVTAQGTITYRIVKPESMAPRIDFTIDLKTGVYQKTPLEQLSELLSELAQQLTWDYMTTTPLREILADGVDEIRARISQGLAEDTSLQEMGLHIVSVRISGVSPTPELEKALQAPAREAIQQESDEAVFQRRAMAVEKELAIAENELQNRIELARREENLIAQQGLNSKHQAREESETKRIRAEAEANRMQLVVQARAEGIRMVEKARVEAVANRMDIYRKVPTRVMFGLATQKLAGNLQRIDHLNLSGDSFGPLLTSLIQSGIRHLEASETGQLNSDTSLSTQLVKESPEISNTEFEATTETEVFPNELPDVEEKPDDEE